MNKRDTNIKGAKSFQNMLIGDYYINTICGIVDNKKDTNTKEVQGFVEAVCSKKKQEQFNGTFNEYFHHLNDAKDFAKMEKVIHLIGEIGAKYPQLSDKTVDALIHIVEDNKTPKTCKVALHEMGRIGHVRENTCNKIIDEINKVTHEVTDHDVTIEAIHALYEIGLAWKKKKKIFFPLLDILKRGDKDEKIEAIRAIRTQLEGYWEKPIEALKDLVLYDDDFEVRRIAAMSLGEVGAYTSFSVREAVFELTENVGHQIQQLKIALEKNKMNNFHIKCRLQDSKAILKILYHYIRLYKYGFVE